MKIGIYDPYLDTMSGGERYMLSIARCLADKHTVSVFWDTQKEAEIRSEAERKFAMPLDRVSFVKNIFTPDTSLFSRLIQSRDYDLIIVLSDGSIPFLACPMILHFQTPVEWVKNSLSNRIKLRMVKRIICNSEYTKKYIDRKFGLSSTVLYPPVDLPVKKQIQKEQIILNLGRMGIRASGSSYKKQDMLRDSFLRLVKDGLKGWKMVFIVNSPENEQETVDAFIASIHNAPVTVLQNPDMDTVKEYYGKAALYWHAAGFGEDLDKHPDRAEHFGLSTVEAMHYGAVPVVIDAGGQPEIVTDGQNGFLWDTAEALREKSLQLIHNTTLRKSLASEAEKRAEKFSLDQFCEQLTKIIA